MRKFTFAVVVGAALCVATSVAAEPIGMVKKVSGTASIERSGDTLEVGKGDRVERGDFLVTGRNGSMGVTLNDGTLISAGPNTRIGVDDFAYEPPDGEHSLMTSVAQGTVGFLSGQIAKFSADSVAMNVPSGTIAVRGTYFVVEVEPGE